MSTDFTAIIVATAGVAGTLTAPIIAQRAALSARVTEARIQREEQVEERKEVARKETLEERRHVYASLNSAARNYRSAALDHLAAVAMGQPADESRQQLEAVRQAFAECHSKAQMAAMRADLGIADAE